MSKTIVPELTQEYLKIAFHYDPETGVFTRLTSGGGVKVGAVAGCIKGERYRRIRVAGTLYRAHRLAWFYVHGRWPSEIDHINGDRVDNRITNLREVTRSENNHNRKKAKGYTFDKSCGKWVAQIKVNYVRHGLGYFDTPEKARVAYLAAKRIYHPTAPAMA